MGLDESSRQTVITAALLGTERQPFTIPSATGQLGRLLSQLGDRSTEAALLTTAATLSLHQRAGWIPEKRPILTQSACDPDDLPRCSPRAARLLQQMLEGHDAQVLPEWLTIAAKVKQRVPELYLPELLNLGKQQQQLRSGILSVLGQRGRWLAAQNADWSYAVEVATQEDWETGSLAARLLYLQALRSHDPSGAREQLQLTWSQESAIDRAKFLESFRIGLSLADEPFLEKMLSDRAKEVRRIAAELLASLPESHLCQRMAERLKPLFKITLKKGCKPDFELDLPKSCDAMMQQDGIEANRKSGMGERSGWLLQIIAATPLSVWEELGNMNAQHWLERIQANSGADAILEGLSLAAQRQGNPLWAIALLRDFQVIPETHVIELLKPLTSEQRQDFACQLLNTPIAIKNPRVLMALSALTHYQEPWTWELIHAVLQGILGWNLTSNRLWDWRVRELLQSIVHRISVNFAPQTREVISQFEAASSDPTMNLLIETLQFRQEVIQAFESSDQDSS